MQSNTDQLPRLLCSKYPGGRSALYNKWEEEMLDAAAGMNAAAVLLVCAMSECRNAEKSDSFTLTKSLYMLVQCMRVVLLCSLAQGAHAGMLHAV